MKRIKKTTYVTLEGLEKAKKDVEQISTEAIEELNKLPGNNDFLEQLIRAWWAVRSKTGDTVIMILEQIKGPEELKALPPEDLKILAQEIRTFLIEKISHTGGHLASNLGVVELTIALFKTLNLPEDKVIWDVGHQPIPIRY